MPDKRRARGFDFARALGHGARVAAFSLTFGAGILAASGAAVAQAPVPRAPEGASTVAAPRTAVMADRQMVVAANPLAADAGRQILRQGGSAVDAAIAMQMVLTLVEPQSSGIGGGGFLLHYGAERKRVDAYDGRETAPAKATADMFLDADGKPLAFNEAALGGHAVGVPGVLRMLELAHDEHGRLPWARLFEPAMRLALDGFPISPRLAKQIADTPQLKEFAATRAYFFDADGNPKPAGTRLTNPDLAETFRVIANGGAQAFYNGGLARAVAKAVRETGKGGTLTADDLKNYRALKREAVCGPYRQLKICGMGPPSSGGIAVLQAMTILERFDIRGLQPNSAPAIHLIAEATKLAFADRNRYLADPEFEQIPVERLTDRKYLAGRAKLVNAERASGRAEPGRVATRASRAADNLSELPATSHISVVDVAGNAVAFTTSIERAFGSYVMTRGFLLNNQMTDFALRPRDGDVPNINRVEPGKRPRSSMAPTIVLDRESRLVAALGSPGGPRIIPYVVQTLVASIDWNMDAQRAVALPHAVSMNNGTIELERDTALANVAADLKALGHEVALNHQTSGLGLIQVVRRQGQTRLVGGADPRREGEALGD